MKYAGRVGLAIFGPVVCAGLLVGLVFLLHASNWFSLALYLGEIGGTLGIMYQFHKATRLEFGLKWTFSWSFALWSMLYLSMRVAAWVIIIPQARLNLDWRFLLMQAAFFLFINAMGEELHFRGLIFGTLQDGKPQRLLLLAAFVSTFLFAFSHIADLLSAGWFWFVPIFADGLALCAIRIKTKSVFWSVLAHGLLNICTGALFVASSTAGGHAVHAYMGAVVIIDGLFVAFALVQARQSVSTRGSLVSEVS